MFLNIFALGIVSVYCQLLYLSAYSVNLDSFCFQVIVILMPLLNEMLPHCTQPLPPDSNSSTSESLPLSWVSVCSDCLCDSVIRPQRLEVSCELWLCVSCVLECFFFVYRTPLTIIVCDMLFLTDSVNLLLCTISVFLESKRRYRLKSNLVYTVNVKTKPNIFKL